MAAIPNSIILHYFNFTLEMWVLRLIYRILSINNVQFLKKYLYLCFLRNIQRDIPNHISCVTSSVTNFDEKMAETCYDFFFSVTRHPETTFFRKKWFAYPLYYLSLLPEGQSFLHTWLTGGGVSWSILQ